MRICRVACFCALFCILGTLCSVAQTFTTLFTFGENDGDQPWATLTRGIDGRLYGTTRFGGANSNGLCYNSGCGTVFAITTSGKLTLLYSFCALSNNVVCAEGDQPYGGLVQDAEGNFYGTTPAGGTNANSTCYDGGGCGTIFRISA